MSQPPVIHSTRGKTSVLQRQCTLGGHEVIGSDGGHPAGLEGGRQNRDQYEVEPVASLSCISTNVPVVQSQPPSLLMTGSDRISNSNSNSTSKGGRGVLKRAMTL